MGAAQEKTLGSILYLYYCSFLLGRKEEAKHCYRQIQQHPDYDSIDNTWIKEYIRLCKEAVTGESDTTEIPKIFKKMIIIFIDICSLLSILVIRSIYTQVLMFCYCAGKKGGILCPDRRNSAVSVPCPGSENLPLRTARRPAVSILHMTNMK